LRNYFAALDVYSGNALSICPVLNDKVYAITVTGSVVITGGSFTITGNKPGNGITGFDAVSGKPVSWSPNTIQ